MGSPGPPPPADPVLDLAGAPRQQKTLRKPAIATDEFIMAYAVIGLVKTQVDQGEWAARAALEILKGKKPSDIPEGRTAGARPT